MMTSGKGYSVTCRAESEKQDMKAIPPGLSTQAENEAEAAVSIIRSSQPKEAVLLLRRRKTENDPWSGHFAFPGGRREPGDSSIFQTCLRETLEEASISLDDSMSFRQLPLAAAGRNVMAPILVQPFLFHLENRPTVTVETSEIESYLWLEVETFMDRSRHEVREVLPGRFRPVFPLEDYYLWGFSYGLLCSIFELDISFLK